MLLKPAPVGIRKFRYDANYVCCACTVPVTSSGVALRYQDALCGVRPDSVHKAIPADALDDTCYCGLMSSAPESIAHPAWCPANGKEV